MTHSRDTLPRRAFTLIEVIVGVVIISVLAAAAAVGYTSVVRNSQDSATGTKLHQIAKLAAAAAAARGGGEVAYLPDDFTKAATEVTPLAMAVSPAPLAAASMVVDELPSDGPSHLSVVVGDGTRVGMALKSPTGRCARAQIVGTRIVAAKLATVPAADCAGDKVRALDAADLQASDSGGSPAEPAGTLTAPGSVSAQAGQPESTDARVSWSAVAGATSYRVYLDGGTQPAATTAATTIDLEALTDGAHNVTVTAVNGAEEGPASSATPFTIAIASNDMIASATKFVPPAAGASTTFNAKASAATTEPGEVGSYGASVWWKFTPTKTASYYISVPYNYHDLRVIEHQDVTETGTYNGNHQPTILKTYTAGQTYWIRIGGGGDFPWTMTAGPDNDFINNATPLTLPAAGTTTSTTINATYATTEPGEVGNYGASVWYKVTPAKAVTMVVDVPYNYHDLRIVDSKDVTATGTYHGGHAPSLSKPLTAGTTYWIRIGGGGTFTWTLKAGPENDALVNAEPVSAPAVGETKRYSGIDSTLATTEPTEAGAYGQSLWWKVTPTVTGSYTVAVEQNYKDLRIVDTPSLTATGWYTSSHFPSLTQTLTAGTTYYIRVGSGPYAGYDWTIKRNS